MMTSNISVNSNIIPRSSLKKIHLRSLGAMSALVSHIRPRPISKKQINYSPRTAQTTANTNLHVVAKSKDQLSSLLFIVG